MAAKQDVIDYVNDKFKTRAGLLDALLSMLNACDDQGMVQHLRKAYIDNNPEVEFTENDEVASGANYDSNNNKITIRPGGSNLDLADNLIFESFNCTHRQDYKDLSSRFNQNTFPPMLFLDYGKEMSRIEGMVVYKYVSLLREIQKNISQDAPLTNGARRALRSNAEVSHEAQLISRMQWTPHDPSGTGDWRFPTPEHYAFRKVMALTVSQAWYRIKYLIVMSGGGNAIGHYNTLDYNMRFQKWFQGIWSNLQNESKPTAFIESCGEANRVFKNKMGANWREITLADYQFSTALELEARRLQKRASLTKAPDV